MSQAQQEYLRRQLAASESTAAQLRRELEAAESALQAAEASASEREATHARQVAVRVQVAVQQPDVALFANRAAELG